MRQIMERLIIVLPVSVPIATPAYGVTDIVSGLKHHARKQVKPFVVFPVDRVGRDIDR